MADRLPRSRTGDPDLDRQVEDLLHATGTPANRDILRDIFATMVRLARDDADRLDLKITRAALKEMRSAFRVFAPYRHIPKVTIFGSARTLPTDPLYVQAREVARELAGRGWMVVTGAGPGIMAAGLEGAGREKSFGINIRLPFEQGANEFIAADPKLLEMKYFFTRKLMLMKESDGFIVLPGGYGTLDETFELLTLVQTGKADPAPIVLLEVEGGGFWHAWRRFVEEEVKVRGLVSADDDALFRVCDTVEGAVAEVTGFYRNYHSRRFVGDIMVMRLRGRPTDDEVAELDRGFSDICLEGGIERIDATPAEVSGRDHLDLHRIALRFDLLQHGRLRELIDAVNGLPSAPAQPAPPL